MFSFENDSDNLTGSKGLHNMRILCRVYKGSPRNSYITKTCIRWGTRNPSWNHKSIFPVPAASASNDWDQHLASGAVVLEVWHRPTPVPPRRNTVKRSAMG